MLKRVEKAVEVFDGMKLREAVTIYNHLKLHGLTMDDLAQYITSGAKTEGKHRKAIEAAGKRKAEEAKREWNEVAPPCPKCGAPLFIKHICKKKGPENVNGWTCHWYCSTILIDEGDCVYQKYTHENTAEEIKKLKERKGKNGN